MLKLSVDTSGSSPRLPKRSPKAEVALSPPSPRSPLPLHAPRSPTFRDPIGELRGENIKTIMEQSVNAAIHGDIQFLKKWFEKDKGLINNQDEAGNSLLMIAIMSNNVELIHFLVQEGADCNLKNCQGNAPIHHAATSDNGSVRLFKIV